MSDSEEDRPIKAPHPNHGGIRRDRWKEKGVLILLKAIRDSYDKLYGPDCPKKRSAVWRDIYKSIQHEVPGVKLHQVPNKWKNLKQNFLQYEKRVSQGIWTKKTAPVGYEIFKTFFPNKQSPQTLKPQTLKFKFNNKPESDVDDDDSLELDFDSIPDPSYEMPRKVNRSRNLEPSSETLKKMKWSKKSEPSKSSDRSENLELHWEILEEIKKSGQNMENMLECLMEQQNSMIANQRELLKIEKRRNELLEEKLREEKVYATPFGTYMMKAEESDFFSIMRIKKETFERVFKIIKPHFNEVYMGGNYCLCCRDALLLALRYLGSQSTLKDIADQFGTNSSTAYNGISKVFDILAQGAGEFIKWPDAETLNANEKEFRELANFPGVAGVLGGCYVDIRAPFVDRDYLDEHNKHSVHIMAMCDAKKRFLFVHAGFPGSAQANSVFEASSFYSMLQENPQSYFPSTNFHIIADSRYRSDKHVLVPYDDRCFLSNQQQRFNAKLYRTRMVIEHSFSLLKMRFQRLNFVYTKIDRLRKILISCCVLHNIAMENPSEEHLLLSLGDGAGVDLNYPDVPRELDGPSIQVDLNEFELPPSMGPNEKRDWVASVM